MRKCVALFLTIFCLTGLIPSKAIAVVDTGIVASGFCGAEGDGSNLTWTLDRDGALSISGTGDMSDYDENTASTPWGKYVREIFKPLRSNKVLQGLETLLFDIVPPWLR